MKLISWNVNGIRAAQKKGFLDYLKKENPDILCVQETKAEPSQLDEALTNPDGYHVIYHSCSRKKGYSGVATFSKIKPLKSSTGFGDEKFDIEGRVTETDFGNFILFNVYFPNGGMGEERLKYKLEFYEAFFNYCQKLRDQGKKLVICGDYNTAHKDIDLARPQDNRNTSGFMYIERIWIDKLIKDGYVDTFREFNKDGGNYTWWSMQTKARERNVGWRIDYFFVTPDLMPYVKNMYHTPEQLGSDHCPVILELDF